MLKSRSFNIWKKAVVLIIVILDYSKINIKVSKVSIEIIEFSKYKELLGINKVANSMLVITYSESLFLYKDEQKVIYLFIQLINKLCWIS